MCMLCGDPNAADFGTNATNPVAQDFGASQTTMDTILKAMHGSSWSSLGSPASVTFSFNGSWGAGGTGNFGGALSHLTDADRASVREILDIYSSVANLTFTEQSSGDGDIAIRNEYIAGGVGGYAYLPGSGIGGNVTLDSELGAIGSGGAGKFAYYAAIHELGHAMGMYHPFANSPASAKTGGIPVGELSSAYSVMAYYDPKNPDILAGGGDGQGPSRGQVTGLQIYDIALLQYKYGANMNYKAGDDVYEWGDKTEGKAIWDAGGNDTFKVADSITSNSTIDLRDGDHINNIGAAHIKIAYNAEIENAIAGSGHDNVRGNELDNYLYGGHGKDIIHGDNGDDVLFGGKDVSDATDDGDLLLGGKGADIIFGNGGNDTLIGGDDYTDAADGDDILYGGEGDDAIYGNGGNDEIIGAAGNDSLYGGVGDDTFVVGWGNGADLIYDFEGAGKAGGDKIRILKNVNDSGITDFDTLKAHATDDGTHTYFDLGDGHGILVANHTVDDFNDGDFDFV